MKDIGLPMYLFHQGTNYKAYELLGCHKCDLDGRKGYVFRVWAPNAKGVSVVGDFNNWSSLLGIMKKVNNEGLWELFVAGANEGDKYKFYIVSDSGEFLKADPYAFFSENRPNTASVVYDYGGFAWSDEGRRLRAGSEDIFSKPMNIYEVHLGSWKRHADGTFCTYEELADELPDYLEEMNYTHVELMPISEYPLDESWGYQVTGYYSPTSRYGDPRGLKRLIDNCHKKGIGVILDWVPAHFCKDAHGLMDFDGRSLYENPIECRKEHKGWGTRIFDYARNEVSCFLISNALYWLNEYHFDGLRVDAVASVLYLDYDRGGGDWIPNVNGGKENLEAIAFFRKLSDAVKRYGNGGFLIAEESTDFYGITKAPKEGGLGFDFKWNMGWMNDTLSYIGTDPYFRSGCHNKMTFSMMYAYAEKYILPVSHDEVVHLKKSLLDKMPGQYDDKFAGVRLFEAFMMGHPGKKLNFMGYEIGQFAEWSENRELDWFLLDYERHSQLKTFIRDLNAIYKEYPQLYSHDYDRSGFEWLIVDDNRNNVFVFERRDKSNESLIFVLNFSNLTYFDYCMGVNGDEVELLLSSDDVKYGGCGTDCNPRLFSEPLKGKRNKLSVTVPALGGCIYLSNSLDDEKKS